MDTELVFDGDVTADLGYVPVLDPWFNYRAENVVSALNKACSRIGYPRTIRVDNGSEFVSRDLDLWAYVHGVTLDFSRPGKPTDNAYIEAFNGRFRTEQVPDPCGRGRKVGGLAQILQRGSPAWGDRHKVPISLINHGGITSPPT